MTVDVPDQAEHAEGDVENESRSKNDPDHVRTPSAIGGC
jgi:hypothetical protein